MIRKQIYIDEKLERDLKTLAARTGEPEAVHVRAALRDYLQNVSVVVEADEDPFLGLVGLIDDPALPDDVAEEHDHYLYGSAKTRQ